jgi:hypothetical protein
MSAMLREKKLEGDMARKMSAGDSVLLISASTADAEGTELSVKSCMLK